MAMAVVQSGSRGPLAAALVAFVLVGGSSLTPRRGRQFRILAVLATPPLAWWFLNRSGEFGAERITRMLTAGGDDVSVGARIRLIQAALRTAAHHPTGVGWGALVDHLEPTEPLDTGWRQYPHNLLVETLADGGWFAALALAGFLAVGLWRMRKLASSVDGAVWAALAVFFVLNAMVSGDINDNRAMFAAVALAWAFTANPRTSVRPGPPSWRREPVIAEVVGLSRDGSHPHVAAEHSALDTGAGMNVQPGAVAGLRPGAGAVIADRPGVRGDPPTTPRGRRAS